MIDNGADINEESNAYTDETALHLAFRNSHFETVKYLVENGADVNKTDGYGNTVLMDASRNGNFEIVEYLLENGADVNAKDEGSPLILASAKGHLEIVKCLAENGADVNFKDYYNNLKICLTALKYALENNHSEIVGYLVK